MYVLATTKRWSHQILTDYSKCSKCIIMSVINIVFISIIEFTWFNRFFWAVAKTDFLSLSKNNKLKGFSIHNYLYTYLCISSRLCFKLMGHLQKLTFTGMQSWIDYFQFISVDILSVYSWRWNNSLCSLLHLWKYCSSVKVWFLIGPLIVFSVWII